MNPLTDLPNAWFLNWFNHVKLKRLTLIGRTPRKAGFPSLNKHKGAITTFTLLSRTKLAWYALPGNQLQ